MVRVITQETYDEVVKENIEEFDMSPEDAVQEAVAQFQAQVCIKIFLRLFIFFFNTYRDIYIVSFWQLSRDNSSVVKELEHYSFLIYKLIILIK